MHKIGTEISGEETHAAVHASQPLVQKKDVSHPERHVDMRSVACLILGGGEGSRLFPLTHARCKPAISFGGRYRLIDVPISNSLNSHIQKIFILTQFLSSNLHKHIFQTYRLETFNSGFIEILGAEQKPKGNGWYQGTADSIRQNIEYLLETPAEYFLILSGDQLYHLNFQKMVYEAMKLDVDVLVATLAVNEKDASRMGIMKVNEDRYIVDFQEKPKVKESLERLKTSRRILESMGLISDGERKYLGSMGIYLFKRQALFDLLDEDSREDFGKHLIPTQVKKGNIAAFLHDDYWEDIGTIESFYNANILLTGRNPPFDCNKEQNPIYSTRTHLPGAKIFNTSIANSIVCEGVICDAEKIHNSIIGQRAMIHRDSLIENSYIMGNDYYDPPVRDSKMGFESPIIEEGCHISRAIIDKNVHIGKGSTLINKNNIRNLDSDNLYIRDGIIVVPRGASIPKGFSI